MSELWREQKRVLENRVIDLEIEAEELREENRELAKNLRLARAQIAAMQQERNYPVLEAVAK